MRAKAFSFIEILIVMLIIGILGGAAIAVLWFSIESYSQMEDYTSAESEMSYAVQRLSREFALIGLGMPNNRRGLGSFALTFRNAAVAANWPIMAFMGEDGEDWGGPVTVADTSAALPDYGGSSWKIPSINLTYETALPPGTPTGVLGSGGQAYIGPELYYAWGIPTGVKAMYEAPGQAKTVTNAGVLNIKELFSPTSAGVAEYLQNFVYDGRPIGIPTTTRSRDTRSWLLFSTLRLPMLLEQWTSSGIDVRVAPVNDSILAVEGTVMGFDEIHLIQAARLYRNANNELVRVVFHGDYTTDEGRRTDVLAKSIVGLQFVYNPVSRLLTMYIASRGHDTGSGSSYDHRRGDTWPSWLPPLDASDTRHRIVVKTLMWRIRN